MQNPRFGVHLLTLILILVLNSSFAQAYESRSFSDNAISYYILSETEKTVEVTKIEDNVAAIDIPSYVYYNSKKYTVTGFRYGACQFHKKLHEITIPETITTIGESCFNNCSDLEFVHFPNALEVIDKSAFYNCPILANIDLPNGLKKIGNNAFTYCKSLRSIIIPNSVTEIGTAAFGACENLEYVSMSNSITKLSGTFNMCPNLKNITLPESLIYLLGNTFEKCTSLSEIKIPDSVIKIGYYEFLDCQSLKKIEIGKGVESIEYHAFTNCPIEEVICQSTQAPVINVYAGEISVFDESVYQNAILKIPTGAITSYNTSDVWKDFIRISSLNENNLFVHDLEVNPQSTTIKQNVPVSLSVTFTPDEASDKRITWHSSNDNIASIDENGIVTGHSEGNVTVTATTTDGSNLTSSCIISVLPPINVNDITLNQTSLCISVGMTYQLQASVSPTDATDKAIFWQSSDTSIVTIDNDGLINAIGVGEADITVTSESNPDVSAKCHVTVMPIPVSSITLNFDSMELRVNESFTIAFSVLPENATNKGVTFVSLDTSVATVDDKGTVSAISLGETDIKVSAADGEGASAICKINVIPTPVESITVSANSTTKIRIGETLQLNANVLPQSATVKSVVWSSTNADIASVNSNGEVTAINIGECNILATAEDGTGIFGYIQISVVATPVESITLDKSSCTMKVGDLLTINATVSPETATNKNLLWSSTNNQIAMVDNSGKINALSLGECDVIATATDGAGVSASCKVIVEPTPVETISISANGSTTVRIGESLQLTAIVLPSTATDSSVIWLSENEGVATVTDNGLVTAISAGKATITASAGSVSAEIAITVESSQVDNISLNLTNLVMKVGGEVTLIATISPETASNKELTWISSNYSIATVDNNGVVKAVDLGECDIVVTSKDGSGVSATCHVKVESTPAESISIFPEGPFMLKIGESVLLDAIVLPENTTNKSVIWESQSDAVLVDSNGLVTAVKPVNNNWIKATNAAGIYDIVYVTVEPTMVQHIEFDKPTVNLKVGDSEILNTHVFPEDATNKNLVYTSKDPSIATVDANGVVTAINIGETTIKALATDGSEVTAKCNITVEPIPVESIIIESENPISLKPGEKAQLTATVLPKNATDKSVIWYSSNGNIVSVDNSGLITAKTPGDANVYARCGKIETCVAICVEPILIQYIALSEYEITLKEGEAKTITASVYPTDATNKEIDWVSADISIVSVVDGVILGVNPGTTTVSASSVDGSGIEAECQVNVTKDAGIESVDIDKIKIRIINKSIFISNLPSKTTVRIVQSNGMEIYRTESIGEDISYSFAEKGAYLILINSKPYKVII